jgi:hypothetical protein
MKFNLTYIKKQLCLLIFIIGGISLSYGQSTLCPSTATSFGYEYVAGITINGNYYAGNTGFSGPGYYDYTGNPVPNINAGDVITISYTARTNGGYLQYFKFWFDFNGNGVLTDPGELVLDQNATINNTTQTFNRTFTVPTTVFNGTVYMRFIMVYSSSPTICGNYSYGNTFDFRTTITGAVDPFNCSGYVYNSEEQGISNIPVKLYYKLTSASTYTLLGTYNTDANGRYVITTNLNAASYNFQLVLDPITVNNPTFPNVVSFNQKILNQSFNSKDFYRLDVNENNLFTVSDLYLINKKIIGSLINWDNSQPNYRIFLSPQWLDIKNSTLNLKTQYPGVLNTTIDNIQNGQQNNFYIVRTGYSN